MNHFNALSICGSVLENPKRERLSKAEIKSVYQNGNENFNQ
jgi:hypothetical protein